MSIKFNEFKDALNFLKKESFGIIDYPYQSIFKNFKKETENRYNRLLENTNRTEYRWMIIDYLGFDTNYTGLNKEMERELCPKIWTFPPYIEDYSHNQFESIVERINKMIPEEIPISQIRYFETEEDYRIEFMKNKRRVKLRKGDVFLLKFDFIIMLSKLIKEIERFPNLYVTRSNPEILIASDNISIDRISNYFSMDFLEIENI